MTVEFDLDGDHAENAYGILTSLVTPRPIALITTVGEDGVVNAAPFSFFNVFGSRPPMVVVAPGNKKPGVPKDTARNIRRSREFVVNLVDEAIAEKMLRCADGLPAEESEIDHAGFTTVESSVVKVPRIAEAPAALECREHSMIEVGMNRLIVGIVHRVHVREGVLDVETGRLINDGADYAPLGRMASPDWYARTEDKVRIS